VTSNNEGGAFFAGLVIGGLVGAALALLLAPQSGEETRAIIRDKSLEYKDIAEEGYGEASRYAHDQAAVIGEKSKGAYEKSVKSASDVVEKGKQTISKKADQANDGTAEADAAS
jgi:gas vesicle protein